MNTQNFAHPAFPDLLQKTLRCSRYARRMLEADSGLLVWLQENYGSPCDRDEILHLLHQEEADLLDEVRLARVLRTLRKQVMVKLILRDINGLGDLNEVMNAMTCLAEIVLQQGLKCLTRTLEMQFGRPLGEDSHAVQQMLVVGMGKLGGGELNVSSDIDLIFLYPEDGETDGSRSLSNH